MTLGDFCSADMVLADNQRIRIKGGRTHYKEAGSMWRERSDNCCFVSRNGDYKGRRYLPADTEIEINRSI